MWSGTSRNNFESNAPECWPRSRSHTIHLQDVVLIIWIVVVDVPNELDLVQALVKVVFVVFNNFETHQTPSDQINALNSRAVRTSSTDHRWSITHLSSLIHQLRSVAWFTSCQSITSPCHCGPMRAMTTSDCCCWLWSVWSWRWWERWVPECRCPNISHNLVSSSDNVVVFDWKVSIVFEPCSQPLVENLKYETSCFHQIDCSGH